MPAAVLPPQALSRCTSTVLIHTPCRLRQRPDERPHKFFGIEWNLPVPAARIAASMMTSERRAHRETVRGWQRGVVVGETREIMTRIILLGALGALGAYRSKRRRSAHAREKWREREAEREIGKMQEYDASNIGDVGCIGLSIPPTPHHVTKIEASCGPANTDDLVGSFFFFLSIFYLFSFISRRGFTGRKPDSVVFCNAVRSSQAKSNFDSISAT